MIIPTKLISSFMRGPSVLAAPALILTLVCAGCNKQADTEREAAEEAAEAMPPKPASEPENLMARAILWNSDGVDIGEVTFTSTTDGVLMHVSANGLTPGEHGFHIHEGMTCEAPSFQSAGGHWNPDADKHGVGGHEGDLPNLDVQQDGSVSEDRLLTNVTIQTGPHALVGHTVIIHMGPDDYNSQPSGNAGSREACGEIKFVPESENSK